MSCLFVVATASAAAAQGLGALAADTEAQRRARGGSAAPVFSNEHLPGQSRLEAALHDFELTMPAVQRLLQAQDWIHLHRLRSQKLNNYLWSLENVGAPAPPSMAEQAREFDEISQALDLAELTPLMYEVTEAAIDRSEVDAARPDPELKTMDPARQASAMFARKWAQTLANYRVARVRKKGELPPPSRR